MASWWQSCTNGANCSGLDRSAFDNKSVSFEEHCKTEHNMWHYLFFIILVKVKDPTEFTGPESYVYSMIQVFIAQLLRCPFCFFLVLYISILLQFLLSGSVLT